MNNDPKNYLIKVPQLAKVAEPHAVSICNLYELPDDVAVLLDKTITPYRFLEILIDKKLYKDAVAFLSHALPKREAIWWAYLCIEQLEAPKSDTIKSILQAVKDWIYDPSDKNRRIAGELAEKIGFKNSASWVAMAVFWSGGSITLPDQPEVFPNKTLASQAISGAIMLAAVAIPEKSEEYYKHFICQAINIANGGNGLTV